MRIIDISQTLKPGIAVWPGDTRFKSFWVMRMAEGDSCNVGSVRMSLHTGTHADAPYHFMDDSTNITEFDLDAYLGPARVVDLVAATAKSSSKLITPAQIRPFLPLKTKRILFKTRTSTPSKYDHNFASFSVGAARLLVREGVALVGVDTPSVDQSESKTLSAHKVFGNAGIAILENLELNDVKPGRYELIALPLKLEGMDASPVRAVLIHK